MQRYVIPSVIVVGVIVGTLTLLFMAPLTNATSRVSAPERRRATPGATAVVATAALRRFTPF
jgi:hypothetical protein